MMEMRTLYLCSQSAAPWVGPPSPVTGKHHAGFKESSAQTVGLRKSRVSVLAGGV